MNKVVGFQNTGVICWFNSLLQSLLSSKHFVSTIMQLETDNIIVNSLKKIIININDSGDEKKSLSSSDVLRSLLNVLQDKDRNRFIEFANGQQSSSEGFTLLMDCMDIKEINSLFGHRYEELVVWASDMSQVESRVKGCNNQFMVFDEPVLKASGLKNYLKLNHCDITFKSEKKVTDPQQKYKRLYILKYLPKILVISLNRYRRRSADILLPDEFHVESCRFNGSMVYKKIAEIDHRGSLGGGHYTARVSRGDQVYICNDENTTSYQLGTTPNTYMTFYEYDKDIE